MSGGRDTKRVVRLSCSFHPVQTSPLDTCVCRRHRYRRQAPLELRNCRCPAAYLDDRPPLPNFQKQAGSWPQKGGWSFCGTLSKTCVERTQVVLQLAKASTTDSSFPQQSINLDSPRINSLDLRSFLLSNLAFSFVRNSN